MKPDVEQAIVVPFWLFQIYQRLGVVEPQEESEIPQYGAPEATISEEAGAKA